VLLGVPAVIGSGIGAILARRRAGQSTVVAPASAPPAPPAPAKPSAVDNAKASSPDSGASPTKDIKPSGERAAAPSAEPSGERAAAPSGEPSGDRAPAASDPPDGNAKDASADDGESTPVADLAQAAKRGLKKATAAVAAKAPGADEPARAEVDTTFTCACGQEFRVSGQGRHRVFWLADADASDPVIGTACPACERPLPRSR